MRVIAGELRGRILRAPSSADVRPTTDRVRESLFNILSNRLDWNGLVVCDLYCGSGSLGIEALSRGAARAVFVDKGRHALAAVRRNIADLGLDRQAVVSERSVEAFLRHTEETFNLMFADPPYAVQQHTEMLEIIRDRGVLSHEGVVCLEHGGHAEVASPIGWRILARRSFGTTAATLLALQHT